MTRRIANTRLACATRSTAATRCNTFGERRLPACWLRQPAAPLLRTSFGNNENNCFRQAAGNCGLAARAPRTGNSRHAHEMTPLRNARYARRPRSEPKTPGKQRSGVGPDPRLGIAQDHYDDVAPRARTACNQTVTGRFGVASFHSVAKRKPL